jgi:hypothetical protein
MTYVSKYERKMAPNQPVPAWQNSEGCFADDMAISLKTKHNQQVNIHIGSAKRAVKAPGLPERPKPNW